MYFTCNDLSATKILNFKKQEAKRRISRRDPCEVRNSALSGGKKNIDIHTDNMIPYKQMRDKNVYLYICIYVETKFITH